MLILLSQNEPGISAFIDLQKHMFPSGSSPMKSTFPWLQRQDVTYYKGEQLVWNKPTWNSLNIPVLLVSENVKDLLRSVIYIYLDCPVLNALLVFSNVYFYAFPLVFLVDYLALKCACRKPWSIIWKVQLTRH
jgi:hypothetical protein